MPRVETGENQRVPAAEVRFIEPMYALAVKNLPEGKDWLYEVKFDGYRCLAGRRNDGVTLWSRRGNLFTAQFPHIARACERLPADTLLDGEIVAVDESGRVSFNLIQHHRSQAQALLNGLEIASCPSQNTSPALIDDHYQGGLKLKTHDAESNRVTYFKRL